MAVLLLSPLILPLLLLLLALQALLGGFAFVLPESVGHKGRLHSHIWLIKTLGLIYQDQVLADTAEQQRTGRPASTPPQAAAAGMAAEVPAAAGVGAQGGGSCAVDGTSASRTRAGVSGGYQPWLSICSFVTKWHNKR